MKKTFFFVFISFLIFAPLDAGGLRSYAMAQTVTNAKQQDVKKIVAAAFNEAAKGNDKSLLALKRFGKSAIPYLGDYLRAPQSETREQAVFLLGEIGGKESLPLLAEALRDAENQIQEQVSAVLFEKYSRKSIADFAPLADALKRSVSGGNHSVSALILLSRFPDATAETVLKPLADGDDAENLTKLYEWSPAIKVSLAAKLALSALGDADARRDILQTIEANDLEELEFLLEVIEEIDAPEVLHSLKRTLDDRREIPSGVPSHAAPKRRLCDLAVDSFVRRLELKTRFKLSESKRYADAAFAEVKRKIDASIPK